jgi:hypothetical protein
MVALKALCLLRQPALFGLVLPLLRVELLRDIKRDAPSPRHEALAVRAASGAIVVHAQLLPLRTEGSSLMAASKSGACRNHSWR